MLANHRIFGTPINPFHLVIGREDEAILIRHGYGFARRGKRLGQGFDKLVGLVFVGRFAHALTLSEDGFPSKEVANVIISTTTAIGAKC
jgi:hypothetical protein